MSRARESTHVWTVADDLPQAVDDLRRDWSTRRTPTWAIDTALPDLGTLDRERLHALPSKQLAHFAALFQAEKAIAGSAIAGIRLPDRVAIVGQAEQALEVVRQARVDLDTGAGVWTGTEAGRAVRDLAEASAARERAEWTAEHGASRRDRHTGRKEAAHRARREAEAQERCITHLAPEIARLDQEIARHQANLDHSASLFKRREAATQTVIHHGWNNYGKPPSSPTGSTLSATTPTVLRPPPTSAEPPSAGNSFGAQRSRSHTKPPPGRHRGSKCSSTGRQTLRYPAGLQSVGRIPSGEHGTLRIVM